MTENERHVLDLIRDAFAGVVLGDGVGLWQAQGLDDYADVQKLAAYRARDEKHDWSAIPVAELDRCNSSLSFFDADGMRFHLPAYLVADLEGRLETAEVLFHLFHLTNGMHARFDTLSPAQRAAVRAYLQLRLSERNQEPQPPEQPPDQPLLEAALRGYWSPDRES